MTRRGKDLHRTRAIPQWQRRGTRRRADRQLRERPAAQPDPADRPPRPRTARLLPLLAVVVVGGLAGTGLAALASHQAEHRELARGTPAAARVVGVVDGEPRVVFTTAEGTGVTTLARGGHDHTGPREVRVRYLPDAPERAVVQGHAPRPWWVAAPVAAIVAGLCLWYLPGALRDSRHRLRLRAHGDGAERTARGARRRVLPRAVPAAALAAAAACTAIFAGAAPYPALICAGVLGAGALALGCRALLLHAEHAPAPRPPRPVRPLPRDTGVILGCLVFLSVPLGLSAHALTGIYLEHRAFARDDVAVGTARVLSEGRAGGRGPCRWSADLRFTADGLTYEQRVTELCSDAAADLLRGATDVGVEWPATDPARVRVAVP